MMILKLLNLERRL